MPVRAETRPTQAQRSAAMKERLVEAATASLIDQGYAHTTAVEVCRRAGVTRGALNHHFGDVSDLLLAVLERIFADLARTDGDVGSMEGLFARAWERIRRPEWKAVIEIWLASRNDPDLGRELTPAIARLGGLTDPEQNPALARLLDDDPRRRALYRLASEAMVGLALGRAMSPGGQPVGHEDEVIDLIASLAREAAAL